MTKEANTAAPGSMVLVIEDDSVFRSLIVSRIKRCGFASFEAANGAIAKQVFNQYQHQIGLVISDGRMPEVGGIEFLQYIRSRSSVPFIMVTGNSDSFGPPALELGANEILAKPFDSAVFSEMVKKLLSKKAA